MRLFELYLSGALVLTLVLILVKNPGATNQIFDGLGKLNRNVFTTLQGNGGLSIG
jgi:hypothetical protein